MFVEIGFKVNTKYVKLFLMYADLSPLPSPHVVLFIIAFNNFVTSLGEVFFEAKMIASVTVIEDSIVKKRSIFPSGSNQLNIFDINQAAVTAIATLPI